LIGRIRAGRRWRCSGGFSIAFFKKLSRLPSPRRIRRGQAALSEDFAQFRAAHGSALAEHALFEALHDASLRAGREWNWQNWPTHWRDPQSSAVREFAGENEREILFYSFLQWIADRSLAAAQQKITQAGMRIGLLADFAVGTNPASSAVWSKQKDALVGLQMAPRPIC
jgi:4-alpha-glucanotransferase